MRERMEKISENESFTINFLEKGQIVQVLSAGQPQKSVRMFYDSKLVIEHFVHKELVKKTIEDTRAWAIDANEFFRLHNPEDVLDKLLEGLEI